MSKPTTFGTPCEVMVATEIYSYRLQIYRDGVISDEGCFGQPTEGVGRLRFTGDLMRGYFEVLIPINTSNLNPSVVMSHSVKTDLEVVQEVFQVSDIDVQDFQPHYPTQTCSSISSKIFCLLKISIIFSALAFIFPSDSVQNLCLLQYFIVIFFIDYSYLKEIIPKLFV